STLSVRLNRLNQPGGGFVPLGADFNVGTKPQTIVVGDLNGDGRPDVVTANRDGNSVSIILSQAGGGYMSGADGPMGLNTAPWAVALVDVDGDGKLDLAVTKAAANTVAIRLGKGDGTFRDAANSPPDVPVGADPEAIAFGDFNRDGKLDFATAAHD